MKRLTSTACISTALFVGSSLTGAAAAQSGADESTHLHAGLHANVHGSTHVHADQFQRLFDEAKKALAERRYEAADGFIQSALKEAQGVGDRSKRSLEAILLLAEIENRTGRSHKAYSLLRDLDKEMVRGFGEDSLQSATTLSELAEAEIELFKFKLAEEHARTALKILTLLSERSEAGGHAEYASERGLAASRLGQALARQGFSEEAKPFYTHAHEYFTEAPGFKDQDLADELRQEAIFMRNLGAKKSSNELFETSNRLQDQAANPEQPAHLIGNVDMRWEPGSPRCHEIIDNDFPLRYINTNKIRVAVTTVDLWELMAVLVCVTNLDDHRRMVGFGDVKLFKVESDPKTGQVKQTLPIPEVNHHTIDRIRRELNIWSLTQDRPWLANMQKNRNVRGLVPNEGHDLFRGPNMFGVWREWGGTSHVVPTKVSVLPSRENVFDRYETDDLNHESGLIRGEGAGMKQAGLVPIVLEPFESRTGELFYIYPRGEDTVNVKVNIGNVTCEFPFQNRKRRIR
ncbi:MAG: tetratricopeptide repeat protein [Cyanobacteria bacterium REEB67]|nr:tetratricopeptide repeat protein [Cyanobacteria bacterium REEB67]